MTEHFSSTTESTGGIEGGEAAFTYRLGPLPQSQWLMAVMGLSVVERLNTTCFRGYQVQKAGNFFRWQDPQLLFREIGNMLNEQVQPIVRQRQRIQDGGRAQGLRIDLTYPRFVGWSSTESVDRFPEDVDFENYWPNQRTEVLRVPITSTYLAPLTKSITLSGELRPPRPERTRSPNWRFRIFSIYPGPDIGRLRSDLSADKGIAFFDWNHPGEPR